MASLPNVLTVLRILLVPLLVVVLLTEFEGKDLVAFGVFLFASLTDFLDGYIARRFGLVTRLGKLLDPAADKILTSAALISLVEMGRAPAWVVVTMVAREFAVSTLRGVAASERVEMPATWWGKVKTTLQIVAISALIIQPRLGPLEFLGPVSLYAALVIAVTSGVEYAWRYAATVASSDNGSVTADSEEMK